MNQPKTRKKSISAYTEKELAVRWLSNFLGTARAVNPSIDNAENLSFALCPVHDHACTCDCREQLKNVLRILREQC